MDLRFASSATKHRISHAQIRYVVEHCGLAFVEGPPPGAVGGDRLLLLGDDAHEVALEVVALQISDDLLLVIHAMAPAPTLPRSIPGGPAMEGDAVRLPMTLKDGTVLTPDVLDDLVGEAEHGYDPTRLRPQPLRAGRPSLSEEGTSPRVQFRVPQSLHAAARQRARAEGQPLSAVLRRLLAEYAQGDGEQRSSTSTRSSSRRRSSPKG